MKTIQLASGHWQAISPGGWRFSAPTREQALAALAAAL